MTARTTINPPLWRLIVLLALFSPFHPAEAQSLQSLTLKRTIALGAAPGCPVATPTPAVRRDNAEARRLSPRDAVQASQRALDRFRVGVSNYDRARFDVALQAFDDVVRFAPQATEAVYNRALARIAAGQRDEASRDLQAYLAADPSATDRLVVSQAIESLRRPSFDSGEAFRLGLLPGFGQFYTRRPAFGVLVVAGVAGAAVAALYEKTEVRLVPYVDPNGVSVPYEEEFTERPYFVPAIASAAVVTLGAAFEAFMYARGTQRAVQVEPARGVRTGLSFNSAPIEVTPHVGARGQVGLGFFARF